MVQENEIIWTNNSLLMFLGLEGLRISRWIDFLIPLRFIRGRRTRPSSRSHDSKCRPPRAQTLHTARTRHFEISGSPQVLFFQVRTQKATAACRLHSQSAAGSVISRLAASCKVRSRGLASRVGRPIRHGGSWGKALTRRLSHE
jgi:hypothetical protein